MVYITPGDPVTTLLTLDADSRIIPSYDGEDD
jgi:hypothetical protein